MHKNEDEKCFQDKHKRICFATLFLKLELFALSFGIGVFVCSIWLLYKLLGAETTKQEALKVGHLPKILIFSIAMSTSSRRLFFLLAPYKSDALSQDIRSSGLWGDILADEDRLGGEKKEQ